MCQSTDRGRELGFNGIRHYQRIVMALALSRGIMAEIDEVDFLPDG